MTRRLFTLVSAASLVLWVAIVVLWVRSYSRHDVVYVAGGPQGPPVDPAARAGGRKVGTT